MINVITNTVRKTAPVLLLASSLIVPIAHADINLQVQQYVENVEQASNDKDINRLSSLIADNAMIKVDRNNKSAILNKNGYLQQVQTNWHTTSNYNYTIKVDNVINSGNNIKATMTSTESFTKGDKNTTYVTKSQLTLANSHGTLLLIKAVSDVAIK